MKRFDSINVIPFIDIMLVLLAIVLTSASFIAQGQIKIDLPVATNSRAFAIEDITEITIDHNQAIYVNDTVVKLDSLEKQLKSLHNDSPVILRVDATVPFESFVAVVDMLKAANLQRLSIQTQQ